MCKVCVPYDGDDRPHRGDDGPRGGEDGRQHGQRRGLPLHYVVMLLGWSHTVTQILLHDIIFRIC